MAENKTKQNSGSVEDFINTVPDEQKRKDSFEIIKLMADVTKEPAKMWGDAIVGFGSYHYKYESGREGDMCAIGFSPRKGNIAIYICSGFEKREQLLQQLGKHKTAKACLYINKLSDVDTTVLRAIIKESAAYVKKLYK